MPAVESVASRDNALDELVACHRGEVIPERATELVLRGMSEIT